jgi:hypothetical protein
MNCQKKITSSMVQAYLYSNKLAHRTTANSRHITRPVLPDAEPHLQGRYLKNKKKGINAYKNGFRA